MNSALANPDPTRYRIYKLGTKYNEKKGEYTAFVDVLQCVECYATGHDDAPEYIHHDVLCTERLRVREDGLTAHLNESDRAHVLAELFKRAGRVLGQDLAGVQQALGKLYEMKLDFVPLGAWGDPGKKLTKQEQKEMEAVPFLSETFLYPLLGKDNARTVLSYVRAVASAAGFKPEMGQ